MIKLLSIATLFLASAANANSIVAIAEAESGDRLLADASTFNVQKNVHDVLVASLLTAWASKPEQKILWVIDTASCSTGAGTIIAGDPARSGSLERYYWQVSGSRIYDKVAIEMCTVIRNMANQQNREQESKEPTGDSV